MIGIFEVLSPSKQWYLYDLIPDFSKTPDKKEGVLTEGLESFKEKVLAWVEESPDIETLKTDGTTSADNESSVILYTKVDGKGILFTGDSGSRALNKAYEFKEEISKDLSFVQVPHHGSRNNVNPDILDNILGNKGKEKIAFISASKDSTKHPRQTVINAFDRRGCKVIATQGSSKWYHRGTPKREGYSTAEPLSFKKKFQE
jgi:beta-lactamase superfamily II metal-dependent hydrolase